jgi:hypothetical protein
MKHFDLWATLATAGTLWVTLRKAMTMLKTLKQATAAILLVVIAVELETEGTGKGAEKKAAAQARLKETLDPVLPDWLNPVVYNGAGMLIDALVVFANRTGFFAQFTADLSS